MNDQLSNALAHIANSLGTTVEKLYPLAIQQCKLEVMLGICVCIFIFLFFSATAFIYQKICDRESDLTGEHREFQSGTALSSLIAFVALIACLFLIPKYAYPEISAAQKIVNMVTNAR